MLRYTVRRMLWMFPVLFVIGAITFLLMHAVPGGPWDQNKKLPPQVVENLNHRYGADDPIWTQYGRFLGNALQGDLGISIFSDLPVSHLVAQRIEPTLALSVATIIMAVLFAVPLGVLAAWRAGTLIDRLSMLIAVFGFSVPVFVIGYLLMYVFAIELKWFPVQGYVSYKVGIIPFLRSIALPSTALALLYSALIARITRASMLEVLTEDYIRTARAKGLGEFPVVFVHALRNALIPVVTLLGPLLAVVVTGTFIVEVFFAVPGLGRYYITSIGTRDYPVIMGTSLLFGALIMVMNMLVDILYSWIDPRIRLE